VLSLPNRCIAARSQGAGSMMTVSNAALLPDCVERARRNASRRAAVRPLLFRVVDGDEPSCGLRQAPMATRFMISVRSRRPSWLQCTQVVDLKFSRFCGRHVQELQIQKPPARTRTQPYCESSAIVGKRPLGVSLSTTPGSSCDKCDAISSSDSPVLCAKALMMSGPSAVPSCEGEIGWFWPPPIHELMTSPWPFC
jgi:hypothetical protein